MARTTDTLAQRPQNALKAIVLMLVAIALFDVMAVFVRHLLPDFSALELSAYRNVLGVIPSLFLLTWRGELRFSARSVYVRQWPLALMRGASVAMAQLAFYTSLGFLELATVAALAQTSAFFIVILAIVILGERVGIWRWSAVVMGFLGAVMILRPGADTFTPMALLPIAAAAGYALPFVLLRLIDDHVPSALLYLYSSATSATVTLLLVFATTGFSPIGSLGQALMLLAMACCGGVAVLVMMLAYRLAQASLLAPFTFFSLITSFALGFVFFGEAPFAKLFPGVILIVGAAGLIMWREQRPKWWGK